MNDLEPFDEPRPSIVRLEGRPRQAESSIEKTLWERFKAAINPFAKQGGLWAKYGTDLGTAYLEAEVQTKQNEAAKLAEEASEIAARTDAERLKGCQAFNGIVDDIFKDDGTPEEVKCLKLAKLMQENPELFAQVEKVAHLLETLRVQRGASVQIDVSGAIESRDSEATVEVTQKVDVTAD